MAFSLPTPLEGQVADFVIYGGIPLMRQLVINRLRFRLRKINPAAPLTGDPFTALLVAMYTRWRTQMMSQLPTAYTASNYSVQVIGTVVPHGTPVRPEVRYIGRTDGGGGTGADTGTRVGSINPSIITARVRYAAAAVSRRSRGGMSIGPLLDADVDGDILAGPYATSLHTAINAVTASFADPPDNAQWVPVIFSAVQALTLPQVPDGSWAVTATNDIALTTVNDVVGTQMHRRLRRFD